MSDETPIRPLPTFDSRSFSIGTGSVAQLARPPLHPSYAVLPTQMEVRHIVPPDPKMFARGVSQGGEAREVGRPSDGNRSRGTRRPHGGAGRGHTRSSVAQKLTDSSSPAQRTHRRTSQRPQDAPKRYADVKTEISEDATPGLRPSVLSRARTKRGAATCVRESSELCEDAGNGTEDHPDDDDDDYVNDADGDEDDDDDDDDDDDFVAF
jgi:hypothetical protein